MDVIQYKRIKGDFSALVEYDVILDAAAVTVFYKNNVFVEEQLKMSFSLDDNVYYLYNNDGTKQGYFDSIGRTLECIAVQYLAFSRRKIND